MKSHTVAEGDCLNSIAFENGMLWQTIWDHSSNQPLRQLRKDPNVLYPGDVVHIPDPEEKEESVALDQRHTFRLNGVPAQLDLQFLFEGAPRANEHFKIDVAGKVTEGQTDEEGRVWVPIPPNAKKGTITLGEGLEARTYDLSLGKLDPVEEITGTQARLSNLGYGCAVSGNWDDESREAMSAFQTAMGLAVTGEADAETLERLDAMHSGE
jgi:hypothetical protein